MEYMTEHITSIKNPRIKQVVKLRNRRTRDRTGTFLIEGYRELLHAIDSNVIPDFLFICKEMFLGNNEQKLIQRSLSQGVTLFECPPEVFRKISYRDRPDGLLAVAKQSHRSLSYLDTISKKNPLFVVAESIEKPGNLGTILRSADAVGS